MIRITYLLGAVLILLGVGAYAYALTGDQASVTALIPAFFGIPIALLGQAAARWTARKALFIHIAVVLAVLGFLGAGRGLMSLITLVTRPDDVARPAAVIIQSIMAVLCVVYVAIAAHSFVIARRTSS